MSSSVLGTPSLLFRTPSLASLFVHSSFLLARSKEIGRMKSSSFANEWFRRDHN